MPKELLPIVDTPILLHVVKEAIRAGVEDIIIIAGRNKTAIEDFFDRSYELEDTLAKTGKTELLEIVKTIQDMVQIISIRQKEAKGLGHAVYTAKPIVGDQPFAVLLGDEIMINEGDETSVTGQLIDCYNQTQCASVAVMEVAKEDVRKYGIVDVEDGSLKHMKVQSVVEKPDPDQAPSQLALPGRYIFNANIFSSLADLPPGKNGEIQLTDAMTEIAQGEGLYATRFVAKRYDAGDKFGYLQANIEMGLKHPQVGEALRHYLKNLSLD